ncbi:MAG: ABC transporter permease [Rhizobiaceae bacterium]|nr:ABC transporter permease [Rhizobiaceae bacterium]
MSAPEQSRMRERLVGMLTSGGILILLIVVTAAVTAYIQPRFLNHLNIINVLRNAAILSIVSLGQMLVIIVGGFDLSVGVIVAFASVETAFLMGLLLTWLPDFPVLAVILAIMLAVASGALIGMANGIFVSLFGLSPFMVTLAMSSVVAGVTFYFTKGIPIYGIPDFFLTGVGRGQMFGVPVVAVIGVAFVALVALMQRFTSLGRHVYAIGSNINAARLSGVNATWLLIGVYAASGATAAITGILLTARIGSGQSTLGETLALESIAAAVVGGVSLMGGTGRAERVMLGALFLALVSNSMNLIRIDSKFQTLVLGVVLIAAVCIELLYGARRRHG